MLRVCVVGGAGRFGVDLVRKVFSDARMRPIELRLHDTNERKLEAMGRILDRGIGATGAEITYSLHRDLRPSLEGADQIICCFCVDWPASRMRDREICNRHGVFPLEGETMTPGGLMATLRHLPILLNVCREMEAICPDALLHIINNPLARLCDGVHRHTRIQCVGHCHGISHTRRELAKAMGLDPADVEVIAAGVNHLTFILQMWDRRTGDSLLPRIPDALDHIMIDGPFGFRFSNMVYELLGYYPSPGDNHIADQLPFVSEEMKERLPIPRLDLQFDLRDLERAGGTPRERELVALADELKDNDEKLTEFLSPAKSEVLGDALIAKAGLTQPLYFEAYNVVNDGCIPNLPTGSIVEVPGVLGAGGVQGLSVGPLPDELADLCRRMLVTHEAAVEACVSGSREAALRSLAFEPTVRDLTRIGPLLDDLLDANRRYIGDELFSQLRSGVAESAAVGAARVG